MQCHPFGVFELRVTYFYNHVSLSGFKSRRDDMIIAISTNNIDKPRRGDSKCLAYFENLSNIPLNLQINRNSNPKLVCFLLDRLQSFRKTF